MLKKNKGEIARLTGHDWKTVSKVIKSIDNGKESPEMKERQSIVEPFKEKVIELLNAFEYFGGVPEVLKLDNLKAAIFEANFYEPVYQKLYSSFADSLLY